MRDHHNNNDSEHNNDDSGGNPPPATNRVNDLIITAALLWRTGCSVSRPGRSGSDKQPPSLWGAMLKQHRETTVPDGQGYKELYE